MPTRRHGSGAPPYGPSSYPPKNLWAISSLPRRQQKGSKSTATNPRFLHSTLKPRRHMLRTLAGFAMRTSRVSKDTSKLFDTVSEVTLPRRSTRSSTNLARASPTNTKPSLSDIEDAIKPSITPSPPPGGSVTRLTTTAKRKRATTTTKTSPSSPPLKIKAEASLDSSSETETIPTKPRRAPRKPARKITSPSGTITIAPPSDWEEIYDLAKQMRLPGGAASNAAVDTMGCERLAAPTASAKDRRFHTLVALMLSSQTKDTVNAEAMKRLQTEMPAAREGGERGLTLENMLAVDEGLLNELIWKVGFHNNKTRYLKQAAVILRDHHNGDIPDSIEGLMSLPGVGPKMAHLCMSAENGWNRIEGIGVDVHVHRITNLWGWQNPPSKTPEETRLALQSWLPRDKWKEINWLLVGLGQAVCLPVGRKCGDCELGLRGLCKAADRKKVIEGRKRRETMVKMEVEVGVDEDGDVVVKKEEEEVVREEETKVIKDEVVNEEVVNIPEVKAKRAGRNPKRSG
ncbi:DNA glycosylase [Cercophora newfieldiana]|uniref:Endonuclease III homolog n=1 Tax=Cercophora newfieldiana TaxID=92897 RepID=A0AA40CL84_9PEZI|nr:DNA glycosylase [Cercophora newfieldiana]